MIAEKRSRTAAPLETAAPAAAAAAAAIRRTEDRGNRGGTAAATADNANGPPPTGAATAITAGGGGGSPSRNSNNSNAAVHLALVAGQVFFGFGSVVAALGLPACHPLAFALARESGAAVTLLAADRLLRLGMTVVRRREERFSEDGADGVLALHDHHDHHRAPFLAPLRQHPLRFLLLGLAIFSNQAGNIVGIKLAGPVAAAVWQPSQPIITAALGMLCLRSEPVNGKRLAGVAVAFLGCAAMVILSGRQRPNTNGDGDSQTEEEDAGGTVMLMSLPVLVGHVLFFINCTGTALYVILSKQVLAVYPSLQVTAWSYVIASAFMAATALAASSSETLLHFLCPDCPSGAWWSIPPGAYGALAYFILFNSVAGYGILTWANRHASGTLVIGYTVLQPVTAALAAVLLLGAGLSPRCSSGSSADDDDNNSAAACLDPPGWGSVAGTLGVFAGLYLVIVTEPPPPPSEEDGSAIIMERYSTVATNDDDDYSSGGDDGLLLEPSSPATDTVESNE